MEKEQLETIKKLEKAKKNVVWLIDTSDGIVDMHGLKYWAGVVEDLREEMKKYL